VGSRGASLQRDGRPVQPARSRSRSSRNSCTTPSGSISVRPVARCSFFSATTIPAGVKRGRRDRARTHACSSMHWTSRAHEDAVTETEASAFFDDATYAAIDDAVRQSVSINTKLGSVPLWAQGAGEGPEAPFHFAAQFDFLHHFAGPAPSADDVGCTVTTKTGDRYDHAQPRQKKAGAPPWITIDGDGYFCDGANYGDAGTAYVFVHPDALRPEGVFFWQCG
jgi:hypothetical protein